METLKIRIKSVKKALGQLKIAIDQLAKDEYSNLYEIIRDSTIQRFEFCCDTMWKLLKMLLRQKHNITVDPATPRRIFRTCYDHGMLEKDELSTFNSMIRDRNTTSHTYNEEIAEQISNRIPQYYETMKKIIDRLQL